MNRVMFSLFAGLLAYILARATGIPAWRHLPVGDATDFGVTTAFLAWFAVETMRDLLRDRDATRSAETPAAPVPQDLQARANGIARKDQA